MDVAPYLNCIAYEHPQNQWQVWLQQAHQQHQSRMQLPTIIYWIDNNPVLICQ